MKTRTIETHPEAFVLGKVRRLEMRQVNDLKPHSFCVQDHTKRQLQMLAESIARSGCPNPILVDEDDNILAGHASWEAAGKLCKMTRVPVIVIDGITEEERRLIISFNNKIAELTGHNRPDLTVDLEDLSRIHLPGDFQLTKKFDALLHNHIDFARESADAVVAPMAHAVSRPGDVFRLGPHRLLCGDATKGAAFPHLMGQDLASMVLTTPPEYPPFACFEHGRITHFKLNQRSDPMALWISIRILCGVFHLCAYYSKPRSIHRYFLDRGHSRVLEAGQRTFGNLTNAILLSKTHGGHVWVYRSRGGLASFYEFGNTAYQNNDEGRQDLDPAKSPVKPVAMLVDAMQDCTRPDDIVLDPFAGTGSVFLAAEWAGRRAYGIEIDPLYVDVTIRRWQNLSKKDAMLEQGQAFNEVALIRARGRGQR